MKATILYAVARALVLLKRAVDAPFTAAYTRAYAAKSKQIMAEITARHRYIDALRSEADKAEAELPKADYELSSFVAKLLR